MTTQRKQRRIYRRMIKEFVVLIIVIVSSGCSTSKPDHRREQSPCIDKMEDLPIDWQPSPNIRETLRNEPWTSREQKQANRAVIHGLDEMVEYQLAKPETVTALWDNSVEAYIDTAYAADNMPTLRDKALSVAQRHLMVIATPYTKPDTAFCADVSTYLTLVIYAHSLSQRLDDHADLADLQGVLVDKTNQSLEDCGSLNTLMGYDYRLFLSSPKTLNGDVYDMVMWSILFIDALTITALNLPEGVESFVSDLWAYLATYPTPDAATFKEGANNATFYDLAYLMTHVGYIPTGYGRHALTVQTAPWLYRFLRANFYAVMEMGELDLTAEFVDLFRQYGCDETNDRQLRDGSRHLLALYESAGQSWIDYRESYETPACNPYDLMHKPWTAIAGLRQRKFEDVTPLNYGGVAKRLLSKE